MIPDTTEVVKMTEQSEHEVLKCDIENCQEPPVLMFWEGEQTHMGCEEHRGEIETKALGDK